MDAPRVECHVHVFEPDRFPYADDAYYRPTGRGDRNRGAARPCAGRARCHPRIARRAELRLQPRQSVHARCDSARQWPLQRCRRRAQRRKPKRARGPQGRGHRRHRVPSGPARCGLLSRHRAAARAHARARPVGAGASRARPAGRDAGAPRRQRGEAFVRPLWAAARGARRWAARLSHAARSRADRTRVRQALGLREILAAPVSLSRRASVRAGARRGVHTAVARLGVGLAVPARAGAHRLRHRSSSSSLRSCRTRKRARPSAGTRQGACSASLASLLSA